jgi:hypothetical protein
LEFTALACLLFIWNAKDEDWKNSRARQSRELQRKNARGDPIKPPLCQFTAIRALMINSRKYFRQAIDNASKILYNLTVTVITF